jgi:hypothetical protein
MARRPLTLALLACLALAGCGGSSQGKERKRLHHAGRAEKVASAAQRLASLRKDLPAGFTAPDHAVTPSAPGTLVIAPAPTLLASQVHLTTLPVAGSLRGPLFEMINAPERLLVYPLFLSTQTVNPGGSVIVAATHLGGAPNHDALFILQGPSGRFQHLVQVRSRVAAGIVTIPPGIRAGTWYLAVEDLSQASRSNAILVNFGELAVR